MTKGGLLSTEPQHGEMGRQLSAQGSAPCLYSRGQPSEMVKRYINTVHCQGAQRGVLLCRHGKPKEWGTLLFGAAPSEM